MSNSTLHARHHARAGRSVGALLVAAVSLAVAAPRSLAADVFTVGPDPDCDYPTIGSANINVPNDSILRVARSVGPYWSPIWRPLVIEGGYEGCSDPTPSGRSTLTGVAGSVPAVQVYLDPGFAGTVVLRNLRIQGGNDDGLGGGLRITGHATVRLENTLVVGNRAQKGGGIYVGGPDASLSLDASSSVESNLATSEGGGIFCEEGARLDVLGASLRHNESTGALGGGIAARNGCRVHLGGGTAILDNRARTAAAGVYAGGGELTAAGDIGGPVLFARNENDPSYFGGGAGLVVAGQPALLRNVQFVDHQGASVLTVDAGAEVTLEGRRGPGCQPSVQCAGFTDETNRGAMLTQLVEVHDDSSLVLRNVRFGDVLAHRGFLVSASELVVEGSSLEPGFLADQGFALDGATLRILNSDLLSAPPAGLVWDYAGGAPASLVQLFASIWWHNVGVPLRDPSGDPATVVQATCLLVEDDHDLHWFPKVATLAPLYVDTGAGDYHHAPGSPAIDYCDTADWDPTAPDLDVNRRGYDHPDADNRHGTIDLGADEVTPAAVVFFDGFERGDAGMWSAVAP